MSAAEDEIRRAVAQLGPIVDDAFVGVAEATKLSITDGSPLTGAPGQPVQAGTLKASWQLTYPTPDLAAIDTNLVYAEGIDDGIGEHGALTLRSGVGGFHSLKQTIAGLPNIVEAVTQRVVNERQGFNSGSAGWSGEDGG